MALGAREVEVEQFKAADAAVADLDRQLSGGTKARMSISLPPTP